MFKATTLALFGFGQVMVSVSAQAHHAACVTSEDSFMTCGAHSGPVAFNLQKFGDVTAKTEQMILCNDRGAAVEDLKFHWVESLDQSTHFQMKNMKYRQISPDCFLLGDLDFTPPENFANAPLNAWRLDIRIKDKDNPSRVYVEAVNPKAVIDEATE